MNRLLYFMDRKLFWHLNWIAVFCILGNYFQTTSYLNNLNVLPLVKGWEQFGVLDRSHCQLLAVQRYQYWKHNNRVSTRRSIRNARRTENGILVWCNENDRGNLIEYAFSLWAKSNEYYDIVYGHDCSILRKSSVSPGYLTHRNKA